MRISSLLAVSFTALAINACGGGSASAPAPVVAATVTPATSVAPVTPPQPVAPIVTVAEKDCSGNDQNPVLEAALVSGDVSTLATEDIIITDILSTAECNRTAFNDARSKLFNLEADGSIKTDSLTAISWDPTHDAALLTPVFGQSETVFVSNATTESSRSVRNENLAVIGQTGEARHMVMGSHPLRNVHRNASSINDQMQGFMENSLAWMTGRDDLKSEPFKVVIAQMGENFFFPDQTATRNWLDTHYGTSASYNEKTVCNGAALSGCITDGADILMISQWSEDGADVAAITAAVEQALSANIPVLYMHYDGGLTDLGAELLPTLKTNYFADNFFRRQSLEDYNAAADFGQLSPDVQSIADVVTRLRDDSFSINFAFCENHSCPEDSLYQAEFADAVSTLQQSMDDLDKAGDNLFEIEGRRFDKGLVLLADHYRQNVTFPMDKITTPRLDFLKSLFADSVVHVARDINGVQTDMGNFSRSDFSHITPITKEVTLTARQHYKAAGVYALPGQTVTVTRNDTADVNTHVKVNLLRSGSTHLFDDDAYSRPKYMTSQDLPIAAGESISFTSPYGGPIQIRFDEKDVDVNFTFQNVGEHAIWRGPEDDASFADKLNAGEYDWAELITPGFQVHSKLDRMLTTTSGAIWTGAADIGAATETHMNNYPHILAGYKGEGIDVVPEIHDFAAENDLDIHTLDIVKHMNADQAACGFGCSGNPYDAYWSFHPLAHGDIHELGHGLERGRFRYTDQPVHTITNPYSYYSKWKYFEATGDEANLGCQSLPYEVMFDTVQTSRNQTDPAQYMRDQNLTEWTEGAVINFQIIMAAQDLGILEDGWHLLARQHIIEREFNLADNNDTDWAAKKDGLGFGSYTRDEARAMSNNDWNLVALSHAMGRNLTDYLEMWGFELSDTAKAHVAAWDYPMLALNFYTAEPTAHCKGFTSDKLPVDGLQTWPESSATSKISAKMTVIPTSQKASEHICTHDEKPRE